MGNCVCEQHGGSNQAATACLIIFLIRFRTEPALCAPSRLPVGARAPRSAAQSRRPLRSPRLQGPQSGEVCSGVGRALDASEALPGLAHAKARRDGATHTPSSAAMEGREVTSDRRERQRQRQRLACPQCGVVSAAGGPVVRRVKLPVAPPARPQMGCPRRLHWSRRLRWRHSRRRAAAAACAAWLGLHARCDSPGPWWCGGAGCRLLQWRSQSKGAHGAGCGALPRTDG